MQALFSRSFSRTIERRVQEIPSIVHDLLAYGKKYKEENLVNQLIIRTQIVSALQTLEQIAEELNNEMKIAPDDSIFVYTGVLGQLKVVHDTLNTQHDIIDALSNEKSELVLALLKLKNVVEVIPENVSGRNYRTPDQARRRSYTEAESNDHDVAPHSEPNSTDITALARHNLNEFENAESLSQADTSMYDTSRMYTDEGIHNHLVSPAATVHGDMTPSPHGNQYHSSQNQHAGSRISTALSTLTVIVGLIAISLTLLYAAIKRFRTWLVRRLGSNGVLGLIVAMWGLLMLLLVSKYMHSF